MRKKFLYNLKSLIKDSRLMELREFWISRFKKPNITKPWILPKNKKLKKTMLICVEPTFNQNIKNAGKLF